MSSNRVKTAFFAFPSAPHDLVSTINAACKKVTSDRAKVILKPWPQMAIFGRNIADTVRAEITKADILVCDVTKSNFNVYYETGFAIGLGKGIAPVVNAAFANAVKSIQADGLFDTIGFNEYENTADLAKILVELPDSALRDLYSKPINIAQPYFFLDTFRKTDFRNSIASAIKSEKLFYRSFDPVETPRFASVSVISEVSASTGVIIPILPPHIEDADRHNLRAAFLAGLAHGMGRPTLLLQQSSQESLVPIDIRDWADSTTSDDVKAKVAQFAQAANFATQTISFVNPRKLGRTDLQNLSLGSSAAENEFRTLESYFVETSEFLRTLKGNVNVVAGRKGSGKTAIFFMVRDIVRERPNTVVTDLKPESHQLSLFREELLNLVQIGVFDHTLAAFWYFVFLSETLFTIRRNMAASARYNQQAISAIEEIDETLSAYHILDSGDFTARINRLSTSILEAIDSVTEQGRKLSPEMVTGIVFKSGIQKIKALIVKHTKPSTDMRLLFDNIDKGWPAKGVDKFDIRLVRLMVETLDKIRRDFDALDRTFSSVVFLRNDIYELLIEETPDRQKAGQVRIDWTDRAKLRQVIYSRIRASQEDQTADFETLWSKLFVEKIDAQDSIEYLIDHCMMRPRFLINIIENSVANAINRGHRIVDRVDMIDAVRQHSNYLIDEFGYEIRDASGISADILFSLIGAEKLLSKQDVKEKFKKFGVPEDMLDEAFRLMLWYGALGIRPTNGNDRFIYDYDYSMKRLEAAVATSKDFDFVLNSALHVALRS